MGFLAGKRALVIGVASERSIASGIALALHREGAALAFSYQTDKLKSRVEAIAAECNSQQVFQCDVGTDESIQDFYQNIRKSWDSVDIIIHSVAYAPGDNLSGDYVESVTREGFKIAHDISSYSLVALAKTFLPLMQNRQGAILTLTYLGGERVVPNYNVMGLAKASLEANVKYMAASLGPKGIRVNAISAGPIRTLAASGIKDFRKMLQFYESINPLRQNVTIEQVGNTAAFLCSDLASGITGECIHVDAGFHCVAMGGLE